MFGKKALRFTLVPAALALFTSVTVSPPATAMETTPPVSISPSVGEDVIYSAGRISSGRGANLQAAFNKIPEYAALQASMSRVGDIATLDPNDVAEYAKQEKVSLSLARKEMILEQQAGTLAAWLESNKATTYAELRIERRPFRIDYFTTEDPKTALIKVPVRDLAPLITVTQVALSKAELFAQTEPTLAVLREAGLKPSLTLDAPGQKLVVELPAEKKAQGQAALTAPGQRLAAGRAPVVIAEGAPVSPTKRTYGGLWANWSDGSTCTSGFTALRNDNIRVTYTASHCKDEGDILLDGVGSHFKLDYAHESGGQDIQQMYTTEGNVDQAPWIRDNLNPAGDATPYFRDVFQTKTPAVGTRIYRFGRNTGYRSGILLQTNYSGADVPGATATWHRADIYTRCGDSGGPVFENNAAIGLIHGVISSTGNGCTAQVTDDMVYMPIKNSTMNSWPLLRGPL